LRVPLEYLLPVLSWLLFVAIKMLKQKISNRLAKWKCNKCIHGLLLNFFGFLLNYKHFNQLCEKFSFVGEKKSWMTLLNFRLRNFADSNSVSNLKIFYKIVIIRFC